MATDKRNLWDETNKSEWHNETKEVGIMLDNLIETAEGEPYAYILIAVEKDSDGTSIGLQVSGRGLLLAQGLASFLVKDDYEPIIQAANHLATQGFMDEPNGAPDYDEEPEPIDELTALLLSIYGNK